MDMDPVTYFREYDFTESFVEGIAYQAELDRLEFVLSYSGFVPAIAPPRDDPAFQQPLDFRRLVFGEVTQLRRSNCRYKTGFRGFDPANFNFPSRQPSPAGHLEIEAAYVGKIVDARRTTARYKAEIHMGSFGTYSFDFGRLSAFQRLVKIVPLGGGEVSHFDYYTGEQVNCDAPFADG